jgi:hypothetical protein
VDLQAYHARFKQTKEDHHHSIIRPEVGSVASVMTPLSPSKRKEFVEGGMADQVRTWTMEAVRSEDNEYDEDADEELGKRVRVGKILSFATPVLLFLGNNLETSEGERDDDMQADKRHWRAFALIGRKGLEMKEGMTATLKQPIWDIYLEGQTWTVCLQWDID